jgi:hypothetical protein
VEAKKGRVKQRLTMEGVLESTALAAGSAKMGGQFYQRLGQSSARAFSFRIGLGFCCVA